MKKRSFKPISKKYLQLEMQYRSRAEVERIVGPIKGDWPRSTEEIRALPHFLLRFDSRELDPEYMKAKLELVTKVLIPIANGQLDMHGILMAVAGSIDPQFTRFVVDAGAASQKEISDEQNAAAMIGQGIDPVLPESGVNAALRNQTLMQTFAASPELRAKYGDGKTLVGQLAQKRSKHWQFMQDQEENKQIGRLGVQPGPMQAAVAPQTPGGAQ